MIIWPRIYYLLLFNTWRLAIANRSHVSVRATKTMARAGGGHPSLITVQKYKFSLDKPLGIAGEIFYRQNTRADTKTEASKHKGNKQLILIQKKYFTVTVTYFGTMSNSSSVSWSMVGINRRGPFLRISDSVGIGVSPGNAAFLASTLGVSTSFPLELLYIGVEHFPPAALHVTWSLEGSLIWWWWW